MFAEIVAEKSIVCLSVGHLDMIFSTSRWKPMSNIRSTSSRTRNFMLLRFRVDLSRWSSSLPGVPTTTSALRIFFIWSPIPTPP